MDVYAQTISVYIISFDSYSIAAYPQSYTLQIQSGLYKQEEYVWMLLTWK